MLLLNKGYHTPELSSDSAQTLRILLHTSYCCVRL